MRARWWMSGLAITAAAGAAAPLAGATSFNSVDFYAANNTLGCTVLGGSSPLRVYCQGQSLQIALAGADGRIESQLVGPSCHKPRSGQGYTSWCAKGRLPTTDQLFDPVILRPGDVWRYRTGTGRVRFTCRTTLKALTCSNEVNHGFTARVTPRAIRAR